MHNSTQVDIRIPNRVLIENHHGDPDACDVIVEMEGGMIYTAMFATLAHIQRQMTLTFDLSSDMHDTAPTRFAAMEMPHVILESLDRDTIEDTIDNLIAMEIFGTIFTQVTEDEATETTETTTTNGNGRRATQEVAAVVLSDVLVVEA